MFALCNWLCNAVAAVLIQYLFTILHDSISFLKRANLSFMNNIAYLTSFGVLNAHFKSFSFPSRHRYIICIVSLLSKWCFQTYLVLKGDLFSIIRTK